MAIKGIDVATYQGKPDWKKVKADGIEFAMIKATQGKSEVYSYKNFVDGKFTYNIKAAHEAGVACGVYHYFTATTEAETKEEAQFFINTIKPYKQYITLYAAIDVESKYLKGLSKSELTKLVLQFCDLVRKAGYTPIVYTNPDFLKNRLNGIGDELLWLALWRNKNNTPTGYKNMKMWQWGASTIDGINGKVDSNFGYFDIPKNQTATQTKQYFKKTTYSGVSFVDALRSVGANTSYVYRKKIATANGINGYTGTAAQNTKLLGLLKQGKLIKP